LEFATNFQPFHKDVPRHSNTAIKRIDKLRELFREPVSCVTQEQKDIVNYWTAADAVMSPEALHQQFKKLKAMAKQ